jgi:hypothetical protein
MRNYLGLFLLLAHPLAAETRQHGNVIFDIPEGWHSGAVLDDGTLVLWSDLPRDECQFCRITIATSTQTGARADTWVASQSARFTDPEDDAPQITRLSEPEIVNLNGRPASVLAQKVDSDIQVLLAVQLFGRMELIGFEGEADDADRAAETMRVFQRDVMPLVEAARFVSEGANPLLPDPQRGELHGVWWGTATWWNMGIDGLMKMEIDHHWLTFWPDGIFYDGTPPAGTASFDRAERLAAGDMEWGSYRLEGARLTLSYASGEVEVLEAEDGRFSIGDRVMDPITPLADGTKLNGVVSTLFVSGFAPGMSTSGGGVTAMTDTRYNLDGTWSFSSYTGASASFDNGAGFATGAESSDTGRYEVKDGLVILHAQDGSVVASHYIFNAGSAVWIGSNMLE